jgi:hypothetical protein
MSGGGNNEFEMNVSYTADWFQQTMCTSNSTPPAQWNNGCDRSGARIFCPGGLSPPKNVTTSSKMKKFVQKYED